MDNVVLFRIGTRACNAMAATGIRFDTCHSPDGRIAIALFCLGLLACLVAAVIWRRSPA